MNFFNKYNEIIFDEISKLNFPDSPKELYEPIKYTLSSGGKRLRPKLVLLGCELFNSNIEDAIKPALALEIFHNFTLLHDDVMDNSEIRRKRATVHKKWNTNVAILSGDAMQIIAFELFTDLPKDTMRPVVKLFNKTALEVCEGQQYDMDFENRTDVTIDEYLEMIRLKTSVLLAGSLKIGAIIGGASEKEADLLYDYAQNIGLAFQLQDDFLDTYGDTDIFGKKVGNDIITNKKTFLLISALKLAKSDEKSKLISLLENRDISNEDKIIEVKSIYNKLDIKKITENKILEYFSKAKHNIDNLELAKEKKQLLIDFANSLMGRKI